MEYAPGVLPASVLVVMKLTVRAKVSVADKPGVLAGVADSLSRHGASVLSIHQGQADHVGRATIEVITHPMRLGDMQCAVAEIDASGLTLTATTLLRRL